MTLSGVDVVAVSDVDARRAREVAGGQRSAEVFGTGAHLDIGQGEVDWDQFFGTLGALGFGARDETIMTVCVFAWEERARESSRIDRERIERRSTPGPDRPHGMVHTAQFSTDDSEVAGWRTPRSAWP